MPFSNRAFLVTGASGAVGKATIARLLAEGARVAGVDRLDHAVDPASPPAYLHLRADLSMEAEVEVAFEAAEKSIGPLWGVVHTVGAWKGGQLLKETDLALFESMFSVNLRAAFLVGRAAMRRLVPHLGGRIVMVSAYTAATFTGLSGSGAYNVSKAGVIALTKVLAAEGREQGVFTNCVAPNTIATAANRAAMVDANASHWVPIEAVVDALLATVSPDSGLNGAVLTLSGR